jgi:hypothetical protein
LCAHRVVGDNDRAHDYVKEPTEGQVKEQNRNDDEMGPEEDVV